MDQYLNTSTLLWSTLGLLILFRTLIYHWKRRWLYYYGSKMSGPFGLPLIGSLYILFQGQQDIVENILNSCNKYNKPVLKFWLGPKLLIVLKEPKLIEALAKACLERDELYVEYGDKILGKGLLTLPVPLWKQHKKIMLPMFSQKALNSYVPIFVKHANELVEKLRKTYNQLDMTPYLSEYSLDVVLESLMGINLCKLEERKEYHSWITRHEFLAFSSIINPFMHVNFLRRYTSTYKEASALSEKMWNFIDNVIEKKRKDSPDEGNLLSCLIKTTDHEKKWSKKELAGEVQTIIAAGSESSGKIGCFVLLMLAIYPKIQQKVHEELFKIFENSDRDITPSDLSELVYLECVIKETLRIFPIVPGFLRFVDEDIVVGSQVFPKGSSLLIPIICIQRDPKYWHDPLKFDPDRFLPEKIAQQERYSFMPFSIPPRNCIGYKFGLTVVKTVVATLLRNFELTSCQYKRLEDIKLNMEVLISATNGCGVTLKTR